MTSVPYRVAVERGQPSRSPDYVRRLRQQAGYRRVESMMNYFGKPVIIEIPKHPERKTGPTVVYTGTFLGVADKIPERQGNPEVYALLRTKDRILAIATGRIRSFRYGMLDDEDSRV